MLRSKFSVFTAAARSADRFKATKDKLDKKISGTFIERFINYMKTIYGDYKDVAVSVRDDIKQKPIKTTFFFTGMGFLGCCLKCNPNEQSFRAKFIQCTNDVSLVSESVANPVAVEHLKFVQNAYNKDLIRYTSFGFFSIIWVDKYSNQCGIYETNCSYLQVPYRHIVNRIIDVGCLNIWWVISRKMLDYDINY